MADTPSGMFGFGSDMMQPYPEMNLPLSLCLPAQDGLTVNRSRPLSVHQQTDYRPSTAANFSFMLQLATWTPDEFVMLLLGRDFRRFHWHDAPVSLRNSKFAERFLDLQEIVGRAYQAGQLPDRGSPDCFVLWAWQHGVAMPDELKRHAARLMSADATRREEGRFKAMQAEYVSRLENRIAEMSKEVQCLEEQCSAIATSAAAHIEQLEASFADDVARLTAELDERLEVSNAVVDENSSLRADNDTLLDLWLSALSEEKLERAEAVPPEPNVKLDPRREKTRDRILIGLATKFCHFDPSSQRSGANKLVADAVAEIGITITERTVGTTLKAIHAELVSAGEVSKTVVVPDRK